ncbi:Protein HEAT INTOLERANT 4 [Stylosanthes scabra]|uniref:Protein HEAT INTOLERANT 4 n=1 Tax=Stylosanthes scabra TaxID=79078 RepID=A0ABU6ZI81_9FABA|nr:Protein HEAT INTOLERANT 4 [Stylosanthes scabra]
MQLRGRESLNMHLNQTRNIPPNHLLHINLTLIPLTSTSMTSATWKICGEKFSLLEQSGTNWILYISTSGISLIWKMHLRRVVFYMGKGFTFLVALSVLLPFPPSDKIGITSVQREGEEIIPMKQMKMDWIPYMPSEELKSQIFILSCSQRRAALKHLKLEQLKKYEYCLSYFYNPFKEDELEQSTEVQILFPIEPMPVYCTFDWQFDDLEEFTNAMIQDEELSADQKDAFKEFVKERVREAKKSNKEAREARRKAIEEMSEETKAAFENIRFYKFYPVQTPDAPEVSKKCKVINRYYGKAHEYL